MNLKYFLNPRSKLFIGDIEEFSAIDLVIGPEGGFSSEEESFLAQKILLVSTAVI